MQRIVVASGKGGVGKTMLVSSLAAYLSRTKRIVAVDADVDCPNLSIMFEGNLKSKKEMEISKIAFIDEGKCTKCGLCEEACQFSAIKERKIVEYMCEGCGLCEIVCPEKAIKLFPDTTGLIEQFETKLGFPLVQAELYPGKGNSGKLVYEVRRLGERLGEGKDLILIDSPAGIGCPVIASITATNLVVGVVEPTKSSLSDLERLFLVAKHFRVPRVLVLNKSDMPGGAREEILDYAKKEGIEILGEVPYDPMLPNCIAERKIPLESKIKAAPFLLKIGEKLEKRV